MNFRHEWKHEISLSNVLALRSRLAAVMEMDPYAVNGKYIIRSLYFDTPDDKALREKLNGVSRREKFRLRYYNCTPSPIVLEKKLKIDSLCAKLQAELSVDEALELVQGTCPVFKQTDRPLLQELYQKMAIQGLRPKTIVQYTREPFIFAPGNVRVTLDYQIRTITVCGEFLNPDCQTIPIPDSSAVLEVKWDNFLPSVIHDLVQTPGTQTGAFSKYASCRTYC